jgi:hypothetical protein
MHFLELIKTFGGKILLSILLGLGLASIFYKTATYKNNIVFNGPVISEIDGTIFKHGEKCYKYSSNSAKCNPTVKRTVDIDNKPHEGLMATLFA